MTVVAIIQARMGSSRLPGKVLYDVHGQTMLARVVRRVQHAQLLDEVVVATTTAVVDDAIIAACEHLQIPVFRGSEPDVLDRYYQAARVFAADVVVRITADCPLIAPTVIDRVVAAFLDEQPDYASNALERTYPRGLDTEVMTMRALTAAWRDADEPYQRAHVTPYLYHHPEQFRLLSVRAREDYHAYRWTVDTADDLQLVVAIYARLQANEMAHWREVVALMKLEPELARLNAHILQKELKKG